jgi:hypothetical protein
MNAAQIVVGDRKVPGDGHRQRWTIRETPLPSETRRVVADVSSLDCGPVVLTPRERWSTNADPAARVRIVQWSSAA